MNIILDSNILFSALIRDSITRKLILEYENKFLFPVYIFEELKKYKVILIKKSGMNLDDFNKMLDLLLTKVEMIPKEVLNKFKEEAFLIVKNIDPDDTLFIACALSEPGSIIWSDDKKLKNQGIIRVINTKEFIELQLK